MSSLYRSLANAQLFPGVMSVLHAITLQHLTIIHIANVHRTFTKSFHNFFNLMHIKNKHL